MVSVPSFSTESSLWWECIISCLNGRQVFVYEIETPQLWSTPLSTPLFTDFPRKPPVITYFYSTSLWLNFFYKSIETLKCQLKNISYYYYVFYKRWSRLLFFEVGFLKLINWSCFKSVQNLLGFYLQFSIDHCFGRNRSWCPKGLEKSLSSGLIPTVGHPWQWSLGTKSYTLRFREPKSWFRNTLLFRTSTLP